MVNMSDLHDFPKSREIADKVMDMCHQGDDVVFAYAEIRHGF